MESAEANLNLEVGGKLKEWPSLFEYHRLRQESILEHKPILKNLVKKSPIFAGLGEEKQDDVADLLSRFVFGVEMVYRRAGLSNQDMPIKFEISDAEAPFGVESDLLFKEYKYIFRPRPIKSLLFEYGKNTKMKNRTVGGVKQPTLENIFEIGAVEEAAHVLFLKTKKKLDNSYIWNVQADVVTQYHAPDVERRALIWKIQYAERYMPQYVNALKELQGKVTKIRLLK